MEVRQALVVVPQAPDLASIGLGEGVGPAGARRIGQHRAETSEPSLQLARFHGAQLLVQALRREPSELLRLCQLLSLLAH